MSDARRLRVLVTGARGFVGKALLRTEPSDIQLVPFEGDVRQLEDLRGHGPFDAIVHLAGVSRPADTGVEKERILQVNVQGTHMVMQNAQEIGARVLLASTCLYGARPPLPTPESIPSSYLDLYSYSKWCAENALFAWHKLYGCQSVILRIFNVYGPNQSRGFLVPDILHKCNLGEIELLNLDSVRDFIYVDDLAALILRILRTPTDNVTVVNAGTGKGHSIEEVVATLQTILGTSLPVSSKGLSSRVPASIADVRRARDLFGWAPKTSLVQGLYTICVEEGLEPHMKDYPLC